MPNEPYYYGQVSAGGQDLLTYRNGDFQQHTVKRYVDDPLLVDWLDPNGEVGPEHWYHYWDFSEANRRFHEDAYPRLPVDSADLHAHEIALEEGGGGSTGQPPRQRGGCAAHEGTTPT